MLEQCHSYSAKLFQGIPKHAANVRSIGTIGWTRITSKLDISRLLFMWRILLLPTNNLHKLVMVRRVVQFISKWIVKGSVWACIQTCVKYGVLEEVIECVISGAYRSINEFSRIVKCCVKEMYSKSWRLTDKLYKTLRLFISLSLHVNFTKHYDYWTQGPQQPWK